jgi:hypothetical protein
LLRGAQGDVNPFCMNKMKQEFISHLTTDEVVEFIQKNTKPMNFETFLTNRHPERLYFTHKNHLLKLFFLRGKEILPSFICEVSQEKDVTRIIGHIEFEKRIYLLMWFQIGFSIFIIRFISKSTDAIGIFILPFGFIIGAFICLLNMRFGKQKEKYRLKDSVVEIIKKIAEPVN